MQYPLWLLGPRKSVYRKGGGTSAFNYQIHTPITFTTPRRYRASFWFINTQLRNPLFSSLYCCSVAQSCLTLCNLMDYSTPGIPVLHQPPEFAQTHVHWVGDAIQLSHPLLSPSLPAFNLSQHQGLFQCVSSSPFMGFSKQDTAVCCLFLLQGTYSAYKLNNRGDNIQPWRTPFPIWNQSVVPCPVLTLASWPAYRFLKRQVRWSGIPISFRIFHSSLWSTQSKALE